MSYLKLTFVSIKQNKLTFLLIVLEITALILAVNLLVSSVADRQMLNKTYENIFSDNSAYVYDTNYVNNKVQGTAKNAAESRELLLKGISDDYEIYDAKVMFGGENVNVVIALSDEIYDRLSLPLMSGNYSGAVASFGHSEKSYSYTYQVRDENGHIIYDDHGNYTELTLTLDITGTLTADTYLPLMRSFSSGGDFTTKDLFVPSRSFDGFIITRKSAISGHESQFFEELGFVIHFPENYEKNLEILSRVAGVKDGKEILENSKKALYEDLSDFLPMVVCILLAVIIGTVSISAIMYSRNERRGGVLWLCGYSRKNLLTAHLLNMLIIFVISMILSTGTFLLTSVMKIELAASANLSAQNLIATVALCAALLIFSMAIPAVKCTKSSPTEYLRRAK